MSAESRGDYIIEEPEVIFGHKKCQTKDVKYLLLENLYEKLQRPNMYDIGGSYLGTDRHLWFMCQVEQISNHFLVHIFVCHCDGTSFSLNTSVSASNMTVNKKNNSVYLTKFVQEYQFPKTKPMANSYVTTYNFNEIDVSILKGRKLYIPIMINHTHVNKESHHNTLTSIQASHDFGSLLTDPVGYDYVIESTEGIQFKVHKVILASHSKVFEAMFKEENKLLYSEGDVMKSEMETDELKCFLEFMYTGTVKDLPSCNILGMLHLADKYEVHGLQELCEHVLCKQLDTDNALSILVWSDMYNSEALKAAAMKFIMKNPALIESSAFKQIKNVDLVQEICRFMIAQEI